MHIPTAIVLVFLGTCAFGATQLITEAEASRQDAAVPKGHLGGITHSPMARLLEPQGPVKAPFWFAIDFEAFGGTKIVLDRVRITYHKMPPVILTHRLELAGAVSLKGVNLRDAIVPPGKHVIQVDLEDSSGKRGVHYLTFEVTK